MPLEDYFHKMKHFQLVVAMGLVTGSIMPPMAAQNRSSPEDNLRIAYNVYAPDSLKQDNYEVYCMRTDGSEARNLSRHPDVAWTYLAAGDRLFFISDRDTCARCYFLYETDTEGAPARRISDLRLEDSWMSARNGGRELIVTGRSGNALRYQLFLVDTENGAWRQLTTDTAARYGDPCFSPDGRQVVFAYKARRRDRSTHEELYIAPAEDLSGMRKLTAYPEDDPSAQDFGYKAGAPRWHPSGAFISYVSKQGGRNGIFTVSLDGKTTSRLTDPGIEAGWHDWSPDGHWLAYDRALPDDTYAIWLRAWPSGEERQLTDGTHRLNQAPVFVRAKE